jgi:hypothetical protein
MLEDDEILEESAKKILIKEFGENSIKSVVLRRNTLVIRLDVIKTPAIDKLFNNVFERKFGNKLREKQLSYKFTYINPKVD